MMRWYLIDLVVDGKHTNVLVQATSVEEAERKIKLTA